MSSLLPKRSVQGLVKASLAVFLVVVALLAINQLTSPEQSRTIDLDEVNRLNQHVADVSDDDDPGDKMDWVDWDFVLQEASRYDRAFNPL